jgi:hypothetical protein
VGPRRGECSSTPGADGRTHEAPTASSRRALHGRARRRRRRSAEWWSSRSCGRADAGIRACQQSTIRACGRVDGYDAEPDAHRCRERSCIDRRDVQPAERARSRDGLQNQMAVRVLVIRRVIERECRRGALGRCRRLLAMLMLMLICQMNVREPVRHSDHGSRNASEQRDDERQQANGERTAHSGMYHECEVTCGVASSDTRSGRGIQHAEHRTHADSSGRYTRCVRGSTLTVCAFGAQRSPKAAPVGYDPEARQHARLRRDVRSTPSRISRENVVIVTRADSRALPARHEWRRPPRPPRG